MNNPSVNLVSVTCQILCLFYITCFEQCQHRILDYQGPKRLFSQTVPCYRWRNWEPRLQRKYLECQGDPFEWECLLGFIFTSCLFFFFLTKPKLERKKKKQPNLISLKSCQYTLKLDGFPKKWDSSPLGGYRSRSPCLFCSTQRKSGNIQEGEKIRE